MSFFRKLLFGSGVGLSQPDIDEALQRTQFSKYLPYLAYDNESGTYVNQDDTFGAIWECYPLSFASMKTIDTLESLFRLDLPHGSVLQFTLYADRHIQPFLDTFRRMRTRTDNPLVVAGMEAFEQYARAGRDGVPNMAGIPLRDYRLFVSLKVPTDKAKDINWIDIQKTVFEALRGASLYPSHVTPGRLLEFLRRVFNDNVPDKGDHYDPEVDLAKQVIFAETAIEDKGLSMRLGKKHLRCTTPKSFPLEVYPLQTHSLFGGVWGGEDNENQIKTPYLYTLNVLFCDNLKRHLHTKCGIVLAQKSAGSFAPSLQRKQSEYLQATDKLDRNTRFVRIIPTMWVWSESEDAAEDSIARVKRVWQDAGYVMQEDRGILKILLLAALPFGFYFKGSNIEKLDRDFIAPADSVTPVLPIQADFPGGGAPILTFFGRKGQIAGMDIFNKSANNHNLYVAASSGSGKSFLVNQLAFSYYACGALIRIIDIGGSYKKATRMLGGRFMEFKPNDPMSLNPFTNIIEPQHELAAVTSVVATMAYAAAPAAINPGPTEMNLIREAVQWAWDRKGTDAGLDDVYTFLRDFPNAEGCTLKDLGQNMELVGAARTMAFNIRDFTSEGRYGVYFNGPSQFDIHADKFVVLELEHLKPLPELYKVVMVLVINAVTQDLYLSDRSVPRLVIFDEAWQFLKDGAILQGVIEEGYRRARKYNGSFSIITQSVLDLKGFGAVGKVIHNNSDFKFYLESSDFNAAKEEGLIDYDDFTMRLLTSVKSNKPHYSEIFAHTPFGVGVLRLAVDKYTYYLYTSDANDNADIDRICVEEGVGYDEAIRRLLVNKAKK